MIKKLTPLFFILGAALIVTTSAFGQSFTGPAVISQPTVANHCVSVKTTGSNVIQDSGTACGGGSGTPGGADTQVQFNQAGSFGGVPSATYSGGLLSLASPQITGTLGGSGVVPNAALVNSSVLLNGYTLALGGSLSLAAGDLTNGTSGSGPVCLQTGNSCFPATGVTSVTGANGVITSPTTGAVIVSATASSKAITGAYPIVTTDGGSALILNSGSAIALSIPVAGSAGFTAGVSGFGLELFGKGAGTATITPASGTINGASTATVAQNQDCMLSSDVVTTTNYILSCFTGIGGVGGGVTSVAQSFTGGLISVAGSPITTSGTLALTVAGTSGGIPYFSSSSAWASSAALTVNAPVIGGGAGVAPTVGSRSGNTTVFGTTSGALVSGNCLKSDASGNIVDAAGVCGGGSSNTYTATLSGNVSGTPSATAGMAINAQTATLTDSTTAGSGTAAAFPAYYFAAPTLAATNSSVTTTTAATMRISGPPIAGTNETLASIEALALTTGDETIEQSGAQIRMYNVGGPGIANREEGDIGWAGNVFIVGTNKNGTGASRSLALNAGTTSSMLFESGGTIRMLMTSTSLASNTSNSFQLNMATASATVPTLSPSAGCGTCGWGAQTPASNMSGIISGTEIVRLSATAWTQIAGQTVDKGYAIASLPTGIQGGHAFVNDANAACAIGTIPTNGGSTFCPVWFDGTNWREY